MDFFEEWIFTRIRERGWPKSKGLLRKKVVSEGAIVASMQDAVRIALILGSGIPDVAKSIVIQNIANVDLATSPSQQDVYDTIIFAADLGNQKLVSEPIRDPRWLQFCLIEVTNPQGDVGLIGWGASDEETYNFDDPTVGKMLGMANRNAHIAMAWAIENPDDCVQLFHSDRAELQTYGGAQGTYDGWMTMAKMMVTLYESAVGIQRLEDLREN